MKRIVITIGFLLSLVLLVGSTIFGERGFVQMVQLRAELKEIENNNTMLRTENEELKKEIGNLTNNLKYLEEVARNELGLVRDGEMVYRLGKSKK